MKNYLILFILFVYIQPLQASDIGLSLTQTALTKTKSLSGSADLGNSKAEKTDSSDYLWNGSYTSTSTEVTTANNEKVLDTSTEVSTGLNFSNLNGVSCGLSIDYTKIPDEELTNFGGTLTLGYKYKFKNKLKSENQTPDIEEADEFVPSLGFDLSTGSVNYDQKFTLQRRRPNGSSRPFSGNETIAQKFNGISLKLNPWEWFTLGLSYKKYSYSKDVNQFLLFLDSHNSINSLSAGISQVLAGFYDQESSISFDFYITENWEVDLSHTITRIISDGSQSRSSTLSVNYSYDISKNWKIGVGITGSRSGSSATTTAEDTSDSTANAKIGYVF